MLQFIKISVDQYTCINRKTCIRCRLEARFPPLTILMKRVTSHTTLHVSICKQLQYLKKKGCKCEKEIKSLICIFTMKQNHNAEDQMRKPAAVRVLNAAFKTMRASTWRKILTKVRAVYGDGDSTGSKNTQRFTAFICLSCSYPQLKCQGVPHNLLIAQLGFSSLNRICTSNIAAEVHTTKDTTVPSVALSESDLSSETTTEMEKMKASRPKTLKQ